MKLLWAAYPRRGIWRFVSHCALLLWLLPTLGAAQQLSLRYYTTADGLGNMAVNALAQEPGGALWVGTENGLYRHDGETIRSVGVGSPQSIFSMVFGADGALWVGGRTGLYRRNGDRFVAAQASGDEAWSVLRGANLAALADGGVLAVGIEGRLWRVTANGEGVHREPALPTAEVPSKLHALAVRSILVARDGAWWFGCGDALCRWQDKQLARWGPADGVPQAEWRGLMEARDGSIWARSDRHVVRRVAGAARFANVTPQGLRHGTLYRWLPLSEDQAGRVLTSGDDGVFRWEAGHWRHFGGGNGLTEDGIRAIFPDRDGDVWLGTVGHGLAHWRGYANWSSWSIRQGLPSDTVWSVADDGSGRVWIGTDRGVVSTESNGRKLVREAPTITGQVGHMVADGRGGMWLATFGGALYHGRTGAPWRLMTGVDTTVQVGSLLAVNGVLWIPTAQGLFSAPLDGSGPLRRHNELDALVSGSDRRINAVCQVADSGVIWLGTGSGLLQFDPQRGFVRPQIEGLVATKSVVYLACGAGRVWLRTAIDRQLLRIDLAQVGGLRAERVDAPQIIGRHFFSMLEDSRGWLWIGTDAGVVRWNGKDWRRFDESNGLAWNDCNQGALAEDAQGSIWVGTSRGVTRIGGPERMTASAPLVLTLAAGKLGSVDLVPGRRGEIPWSTQPLELQWEVPFFTNRQAQHTRYRLHGRDDAWSDITRSELRYAGLGPGSYSLELVAVNDDMAQHSQLLVLDFEIAPPWWQSSLAWGAVLTAALLLAYAGYRMRVRRLIQNQSELEAQLEERTRDISERKRMAQSLEESQLLLRQLAARNEDAREDERRNLKREIHDELGQYLSALRLGISVVDIQLEKVHSPLREQTLRLIDVVDSTIKVVRHVVAALRPSALELGIVSALEWLAQECSGRSGIQCELRIPVDDLNMDDKRATAVFRIVQESLTNVLRHAQATQVKISLEREDDRFLLEVQDNGIGFDPAWRKEASFGLISIRERALMLGGEVDISSVPGRTVIRVGFPARAGKR